MASPPSGHRKKPHIASPDQPSTSQKIPSKPHSNPICKTLIVLLAVSFFPSQAPHFISRTISPHLWEALHLLFVGIAVSYGLFCRKSAPKIETSRIDDAYFSEISHLSSVFEDGFVNTRNGADNQDHDSMQSSCSSSCQQDPVLGQSRCVVHGGCITAKFQSFEDVRKNRTNYSRDESLVAVANGETLDLKPFNLPVRSLRSNVAKGKGYIEVAKIRGVVPINLEKRFEEVRGEPSVERNVTEESEEGRESELKESSDEEDDGKTNIGYDSGSEVDRKAGEFIAKFREQIRRQQALSAEKRYSRRLL